MISNFYNIRPSFSMLIKSRVDKKKRKILLQSLQGHHFLSYLLQKAQRLASSFPNPKYLCHFLSGLINYFKTCVEIEIPSLISSLLCMNDNFLLKYRGQGEERCPPPTKSKNKGELRPGLHKFSANSKLELI